MFVGKNRGGYEKMKNFKETKKELLNKKLKVQQSKQCCFHDMQDFSEPSFDQQKKVR